MQIQLESPEPHSIEAYSNDSVTINGKEYRGSLIISPQEIITEIKIKSLADLDQAYMDQLLAFNTKIILLGFGEKGDLPPPLALQMMQKKQVALECMSIGAACRTWNILLGEGRSVVAGLIFSDYAMPFARSNPL